MNFKLFVKVSVLSIQGIDYKSPLTWESFKRLQRNNVSILSIQGIDYKSLWEVKITFPLVEVSIPSIQGIDYKWGEKWR